MGTAIFCGNISCSFLKSGELMDIVVVLYQFKTSFFQNLIAIPLNEELIPKLM